MLHFMAKHCIFVMENQNHLHMEIRQKHRNNPVKPIHLFLLRMTRSIVTLLFLLALLPASAQRVAIHQLRNGMTVWLNPDSTESKFIGYVVVKAGARDCPNTGIAHYFEHIMFKGTQQIGTTDYAHEKPLLDEISRQYNLLSQTTDPKQRTTIQLQINKLNQQAARYAIPNEFSKLLTRYGGTGINAYTDLDETVYHSECAPQYIAQWCQLNSDRFINPVFRLFQGELETVYEEKNRAEDNFGMQLMEHLQEMVFKGSNYEYPVIGSTENLKNPRLSDMEAFYQKYYVANNMALILCGNFKEKDIIPLLEKTFGRIRSGETPMREPINLTDFNPNRTLKIKIPFPLIKASALVFRGPTPRDRDYTAMQIAMHLLSNSNNSGLIDSLSSHHHVMYSMAAGADMFMTREVGLLGVAAVPNLPFGSKRKAEHLLWQQINKLKSGEFSAESLEAAKTEYLKQEKLKLENINSRISLMAGCYARGIDWNDYIRQISTLPQLQKADIMAACQHYFGNHYLLFHKKFGKYKKDKISKPPYAPVQTDNQNRQSDYAVQLAKTATPTLTPQFIALGKEVTTRHLGPQADLYTTANPQNDIFRLTLSWHQIQAKKPIHTMSDLFDYLGTSTLSKQAFAKQLQALGTTLSGNYALGGMSIQLSGFDNNLAPSIRLLTDLLQHPKTDKKFIATMKKDAHLGDKFFGKDMEAIHEAVLDKIAMGNKAFELQNMPTSELKRLQVADIEGLFKAAQTGKLTVSYSGNIAADSLANLLKPVTEGENRQDYKGYDYEVKRPEKPTIYLYDKADARQAIVGTYTVLPPLDTEEKDALFTIWRNYFSNGSLNSVLFRELRDLRSLVYTCGGRTYQQWFKAKKNRPIGYFTTAGTQTDKALTTLSLIDSLLTDMPIDAHDLQNARQSAMNNINNSRPTFRNQPGYMAEAVLEGYTEDPNKARAAAISQTTNAQVIAYYQQHIQHAPRSYFIIGNLKAIDRKALERYGKVVVEFKKDDIHR